MVDVYGSDEYERGVKTMIKKGMNVILIKICDEWVMAEVYIIAASCIRCQIRDGGIFSLTINS